jgi:murein DD-endopeptidase MepM/ murein hydrolase activator NlpD
MEQERKEHARTLKAQERERRAEREQKERAEKLRAKREESLRQERERAARMHARREQMVRPAAEAPEAEAPAGPTVVAVPEAPKAPPATVEPIPRGSLKRPTLKAALALAAITAAAFGAGTLLGLPLPNLGSDSGESTSLATGSLSPLDSGTPASLTQGPFLPVRGNVDFGQKDARFGAPRSGHMHEGQDMFAKSGTPLLAVRDGVVVDRGKVNGQYSGGRGNYLAIYSPLDDRSFVYLHLLEPAPVFVGDQVRAGQQIGQMGCTGTCFGTHLHFEIRVGRASLRADTKALDPLPYLRQWPQAPPPSAP